ncbi:MAG: DUF4255 domain-containing protein [Oceanospirillaceae bacterium]
MASFRAIPGILAAIKKLLERKIVEDSYFSTFEPEIVILGNKELHETPSKNQIGLYLHRVSVDPIGRNRYININTLQATAPELPVNLHLLIIAWTDSGENEGLLIGWAMQHIGSALSLDVSHLSIWDPSWDDTEQVQIVPEEMSTENLLRIWEALPHDYLLSVPYLVKTLRMYPLSTAQEAPLVESVVSKMQGYP